jgi:branched-chain amino acid aminotransferase
MAQDMVWIDGGPVPAEQAKVSVFDMGFLRGIAGFESLRTYGGHPHALSLHLDRLWNCTRAFGVEALFDEATVRRQISALIAGSGHEELRINCVVTPGLNTDGLFAASEPTWIIIARRLVAPPARFYSEGIAAVTFNGGRLLPHLKTTNYFSGQEGMLLAQRHGAAEAIYVDEAGQVSEGVTSNVLILRDGCVIEPEAVALPGITKELLKPLAQAMGLGWRRELLRREDLLAADELWISSSIRELVPVVRLDGETIGDGRPGQVAIELERGFHAACIASAATEAGG